MAKRTLAAFGFLLAMLCIPMDSAAKGGRAAGFSAAFSSSIMSARQRRELVGFHDFLRQHPETDTALRTSPEKVRDPAFLGADPALESYLQTHRPFAKQLKRNPRQIMSRVVKLKN